MYVGRVGLTDKRRVSLPFVVIDAFDRLSGRTLDKLGWGDFGVREIRQWMAW